MFVNKKILQICKHINYIGDGVLIEVEKNRLSIDGVIGDGVEKVCIDEPFGGGLLFDGGDGVSSVGEWIDVLHDGVEDLRLCTDAGDGVLITVHM